MQKTSKNYNNSVGQFSPIAAQLLARESKWQARRRKVSSSVAGRSLAREPLLFRFLCSRTGSVIQWFIFGKLQMRGDCQIDADCID